MINNEICPLASEDQELLHLQRKIIRIQACIASLKSEIEGIQSKSLDANLDTIGAYSVLPEFNDVASYCNFPDRSSFFVGLEVMPNSTSIPTTPLDEVSQPSARFQTLNTHDISSCPSPMTVTTAPAPASVAIQDLSLHLNVSSTSDNNIAVMDIYDEELSRESDIPINNKNDNPEPVSTHFLSSEKATSNAAQEDRAEVAVIEEAPVCKPSSPLPTRKRSRESPAKKSPSDGKGGDETSGKPSTTPLFPLSLSPPPLRSPPGGAAKANDSVGESPLPPASSGAGRRPGVSLLQPLSVSPAKSDIDKNDKSKEAAARSTSSLGGDKKLQDSSTKLRQSPRVSTTSAAVGSPSSSKTPVNPFQPVPPSSQTAADSDTRRSSRRLSKA